VTNFGGNRVRLRNRQLRIDCNIHLGMQAMAEPACPDLGDMLDLRHFLCHMANFIDDARLGTI